MSDVVTLDQVRDLIKSEKLRPSDLFGTETLTADPVVKGFADDRVKERIGAEFARRKEAEEKLGKIEDDKKKELEKLQAENKKLKTSAAKSQLGTLLDKQRETRKLDERQVKYIQNRMQKFNPENPDELEKEFDKYLDSEIEEYKKLAKDVFGIESDNNDDKDKKKPGGAEPDETKPPDEAEKYTDPKQNPMIKTE